MSEENKKQIYEIDALFKNSHNVKTGNNVSCIIIGPTEIGKTYLALDFPGPIKMINLDYGLTQNKGFFLDKEIEDMKCTSFADAVIKDDEYKWDKVNPINSLKLFEAGVGALLRGMHGGTVIIDSITTVNDWLKMLLDYKTDVEERQTEGGKIAIFDWKWVNMEWKWLWQLMKSIDANLVVVVRSKDEFIDFKKTGNLLPDYRDGTKFEVSIEIEMYEEVKQIGNEVTTKRMSKFNKFRGVSLSKDYTVENLSYEKLMEILKTEGKVQ